MSALTINTADKVRTLNEALSQHGGKFFSMKNRKKDGSIREWKAVRMGVYKHTKGGINKNPNLGKTQVIVWDSESEGYRTINLETVIELKMTGNHLKFA